jgi:hypothetical protein
VKPSAKIQRWADKAEELARVKAEELALRLELVAEHFPKGCTGTVKVEVGAGYVLAGEFGVYYRLPAEDKTRPVLNRMAAADAAGPELVKRLVKWTPEVRVGELKQLPPRMRSLIDKVLTVSPATPSLELREPK